LDESKLIELIEALGTALRADMSTALEEINKKCDAMAGEIAKKKDGGDPDDDMAEQVAADEAGHRSKKNEEMRADSSSDIRVANSLLNGLARDMADMKKKITRPMGDLNQFSDIQEKADSALRTHGERAEPPMAGEEIVPYAIRMHRKMQPHSKKWKNVDLAIIAADRAALENVFSEIRSDTVAASMNTEGMQPFQYREITKTMPGGHKLTEFIGNGTFIKQMSRPVRHVTGFRTVSRT
jgi:hypothetical protein